MRALERTLEVNARFGVVLRELPQGGPGVSFPSLMIASGLAHTLRGEDFALAFNTGSEMHS